MMLKYVILILFFLRVILVQAGQESPIFSIKASNDSASSSINMRLYTLDYQNHRRNILWPYENSENENYDFGIAVLQAEGRTTEHTFKGTQISGMLGKKFSSNNYISVKTGTHILENKAEENNVISYRLITGEINYQNKVNNFETRAQYLRDFMYKNMFLPAGVEDGLVESTIQIGTKWKFAQFGEYNMNVKHVIINDRNHLTSIQTSINLKHDFSYASLWAGLGADYGRSRFLAANYPSPQYVFGVGPNIGVSLIPYDNMSLTLAHGETTLSDNSKTKATDRTSSINWELGSRNSTQLSLTYIRMESETKDDFWYDDQLNVSINHSL